MTSTVTEQGTETSSSNQCTRYTNSTRHKGGAVGYARSGETKLQAPNAAGGACGRLEKGGGAKPARRRADGSFHQPAAYHIPTRGGGGEGVLHGWLPGADFGPHSLSAVRAKGEEGERAAMASPSRPSASTCSHGRA